MIMRKPFVTVLQIAKHTLADEVRQKSFAGMFAICALFVVMVRGCYRGNYVVNGQMLDAAAIAGTVSKVTFNVIAMGAMLLAALLSMRVFKRDLDGGVQMCILSKPIERWQYLSAKILALWALATVFMFSLHVIIFLIASIQMKVILPGYLAASIVCSLNLLFVVLAVLLLSMLLPDFIAFLCVMAIGVGSYVGDGIYAISHSQMVQAMVRHSADSPQAALSGWEIVYQLWPKISGTQQLAAALFSSESLQGFASLYPLGNILLYCLVLGILLFHRFQKEDIL